MKFPLLLCGCAIFLYQHIGMAFMVLSARRFLCMHIGFGAWALRLRTLATVRRACASQS